KNGRAAYGGSALEEVSSAEGFPFLRLRLFPCGVALRGHVDSCLKARCDSRLPAHAQVRCPFGSILQSDDLPMNGVIGEGSFWASTPVRAPPDVSGPDATRAGFEAALVLYCSTGQRDRTRAKAPR